MLWDGSLELEMALIGPVVDELQHPQELGCPTGMLECAWQVNYLMTLLLHIYGPRWIYGTWDGVNQPSGCWVTASAKTGVPHKNAPTYLTGKWLCCYTSMEPIGPAVVKLQYRQGWTHRQDRLANGLKDGQRLFYSPPYFPSSKKGKVETKSLISIHTIYKKKKKKNKLCP